MGRGYCHPNVRFGYKACQLELRKLNKERKRTPDVLFLSFSHPSTEVNQAVRRARNPFEFLHPLEIENSIAEA